MNHDSYCIHCGLANMNFDLEHFIMGLGFNFTNWRFDHHTKLHPDFRCNASLMELPPNWMAA